MSSLFAMRALLFASELLAGSLLIMTLAWLTATQKAASTRHLTWASAFGATLVLPVLALTVPSPFRILLASPPHEPAIPRLLSAAAMAADHVPSAPGGFSIDPSTVVLALAALWLFGAATIALRFAVGTLCLAVLKRRSRLYALAPDNLPKVPTAGRECELRLSDSNSGPVTWGVREPVILLPNSALSWSRERLHAVLLHELAHIRRRDSLVQALSHIVCAIYWPNPLVWISARRLRREAEMAADDAVLVSGFKPSTYAGELLRLATEFRMQQRGLSGIPLSMAAPSALEARVKSVLAPTSLRSGVTSMDILKIAGAGLLAATALAIGCPSLAQDAPTVASAAPAAIVPAEALSAPSAHPAAPAAPAADASSPAPPEAPAAAEATDLRVDARESRGMRNTVLQRLHIDIARIRREAREAVARARPEMARAIAEARASREQPLRAMREAQPQIDAALDEADKARPELDRAIEAAGPQNRAGDGESPGGTRQRASRCGHQSARRRGAESRGTED